MSTMTLLPCPFCGGEPEIVRAQDEDGRFAAVGCPHCGAGSRQHYFVGDDAVPHVVSAWNRRAHLAQPAQAVVEVYRMGNGLGSLVYTDYGAKSDLPHGTKLYLHAERARVPTDAMLAAFVHTWNGGSEWLPSPMNLTKRQLLGQGRHTTHFSPPPRPCPRRTIATCSSAR